MEIAIFALVSTLLAALGAGGGWFLGSQAGHRAVNDGMGGVLAQFGALQVAMGSLASQVSDDMTRAAAARNRATSAESNASRAKRATEEAAGPQMSEEAYRSHLAQGGQVIPEVERTLGLIA